MAAGLPLMKSLITPSAKSVLVPLGLSSGRMVRRSCSYSKDDIC